MPAPYIDNLLIDDWFSIGWYDFDGNILNTPTQCYIINKKTGEEVSIAGHELDKNPHLIRWDNAPFRLHEDSFVNFWDFSKLDKNQTADYITTDIIDAIKSNNFAKSFESFKQKFLVKARFFAIITARSHSPQTLERAIRIINEYTLTDDEKNEQIAHIKELWSTINTGNMPSRNTLLKYYFSEIASYYSVSSPHTSHMLQIPHALPSSIKKTHAMNHLIQQTRNFVQWHLPNMKNLPLNIGFSDDSEENINAMKQFFEDYICNPHHQNDKITLYLTGKNQQKYTIHHWY